MCLQERAVLKVCIIAKVFKLVEDPLGAISELLYKNVKFS